MKLRGFVWGLLFLAVRLMAAGEEPAGGVIWRGGWMNRFGETQIEWVLELPDRAGEVAGILRSGETMWTVTGKREGAWLELTWKDADGRTTQARGVVGAGQWRGLTLSGGGGHVVEYGRFAVRRGGAPVATAPKDG